MEVLEKRFRFEFIPTELYDNLDDRVRKDLEDYREKYRLVVLKQKRVDTLTKKLKEQRELFRDMKQELTHLLPTINHLKKDFRFSCSVVSFKKGNNRYYNLCISRTGRETKSCSLGNEKKIKKLLLDYHKGNRTVVKKIKSNWKRFLQMECNWGDTNTRIMERIMLNPLGFTINRDILFPIKQTKRK